MDTGTDATLAEADISFARAALRCAASARLTMACRTYRTTYVPARHVV